MSTIANFVFMQPDYHSQGLGGRLVVKMVFPDNSEKELKFGEQAEFEEAI